MEEGVRGASGGGRRGRRVRWWKRVEMKEDKSK